MSESRSNPWAVAAGTVGVGALIGGLIYGAMEVYEMVKENEREKERENAQRIARRNVMMDSWRNDLMDARRRNALMDSQWNDQMDSQRNDLMDSQRNDQMDAQRNAFADRRGLESGPSGGTTNVCQVCKMTLGSDVITLECKHEFHKMCFVANILAQKESNPHSNRRKCPLEACKQELSDTIIEQFTPDVRSRVSSISSVEDIQSINTGQLLTDVGTRLSLSSSNEDVLENLSSTTSGNHSSETGTRLSSTSEDQSPSTNEQLSTEAGTRLSSTSEDQSPSTNEQLSAEVGDKLSSTSEINISSKSKKRKTKQKKTMFSSNSNSCMPSSSNSLQPTDIENDSQNSLTKSVDVSGIKYQKDEDLVFIFNKISEKINFNFEGESLDEYYRHERNGVFCDIITYKFSKLTHKSNFLECCKENRNALNTHEIDIYKIPMKRKNMIIVTEAMNSYNRLLFTFCTSLQNAGHFKFLWFRNGSVYIKRNDNARKVKIQSENDINNTLDEWLCSEPESGNL